MPDAPSQDHEFGFDTLAVHAGQRPDPTTGARAMPIYQSTSFVFEDTAHAAELFALQRFGNIYLRIMNPTTAAFEARIAALEGGVGGLAVASGLAAQYIALVSLLGPGDQIVASSALYAARSPSSTSPCAAGGSIRFLSIRVIPKTSRKAITPKTRVLYGETIGNCAWTRSNIAAVAEIAHERVLLMIHNTFATPALCKPIGLPRCRHRGPFRDQVHRRSRHLDWRRDRRIGSVSVG